jgi:hypothetical protein
MTAPDVLALGRAAARNALASYGSGRAPRYPALPAFMVLRYEVRQRGAEITHETHATFVAAYVDELGGAT